MEVLVVHEYEYSYNTSVGIGVLVCSIPQGVSCSRTDTVSYEYEYTSHRERTPHSSALGRVRGRLLGFDAWCGYVRRLVWCCARKTCVLFVVVCDCAAYVRMCTCWFCFYVISCLIGHSDQLPCRLLVHEAWVPARRRMPAPVRSVYTAPGVRLCVHILPLFITVDIQHT